MRTAKAPVQGSTNSQSAQQAQVVAALKRSAQRGQSWQWMGSLGQVEVLEQGELLFG